MASLDKNQTRNKKDGNSEVDHETKKDGFCLVITVGQQKRSDSLGGLELQGLICASMLYH